MALGGLSATAQTALADSNKDRHHISSLYNNGKENGLEDVVITWDDGYGPVNFCMENGQRSSGNDYTVKKVHWVRECAG
ncbi:hypothetical protein [Streptomyces endophyticus]|uniref:Uncharacterized protein n=1 Tax=Streptomyces endophyticus TaxID=714166 RepID=A0ABU6F8U9_9ACTN|nr:hypothetical protein [Streptomyces endophyticus]MEB8340264.1 hypothetical protein [Streptomyces endophyticus]